MGGINFLGSLYIFIAIANISINVRCYCINFVSAIEKLFQLLRNKYRPSINYELRAIDIYVYISTY